MVPSFLQTTFLVGCVVGEHVHGSSALLEHLFHISPPVAMKNSLHAAISNGKGDMVGNGVGIVGGVGENDGAIVGLRVL